ncbi:unnamed protein product [Caretta caretta]
MRKRLPIAWILEDLEMMHLYMLLWLAFGSQAYSSDGVNPEPGVPTVWGNFPWITVVFKVNDTEEIYVNPGDQKSLQ